MAIKIKPLEDIAKITIKGASYKLLKPYKELVSGLQATALALQDLTDNPDEVIKALDLAVAWMAGAVGEDKLIKIWKTKEPNEYHVIGLFDNISKQIAKPGNDAVDILREYGVCGAE